MKKTCLLLIVLISISSVLVSCADSVDSAGTEKLRDDFIGKTFIGVNWRDTLGSDSRFGITSETTYIFVFTDEDTVSFTNIYRKEYGSAYNQSDTEEEYTENLPYAVKKTQSGKSYVFIQGFGSDGKDTSNNDDGLEIVFDKFGEIDYFIYYSLGDKIYMEKE